MQLTGIKAYHIRAEDLIRDGKKFDIVTARAVASLPKLLPWTVPLVNQTGSFLAMKGNVEEELEQSKTMMKSIIGMLIKRKFLLYRIKKI